MTATLIGTGLAGALLRWPTPDDVPTEVELVANGTSAGFVRVVRFPPGLAPVAELARPDEFAERVGRLDALDPLPPNARSGAGLTARWSVAGEATPWTARDDDDGETIAWDLTAAAGLDAVRPVAGQTYRATLDVAQHRCAAGLMLAWLDAAGGTIGRDRAWRIEGPAGGHDPADYAPIRLASLAPEGAAGLRLRLLQGPVREGGDAFLFFRRPSLAAGAADGLVLPVAEPAMLGGDARCYGAVPLGDALLLHGAPLALRLDGVELPLPPAGEPIAPQGWSMRMDGGAMVVAGDAAPGAPPLLVLDGEVQAVVSLREDRAVVPLDRGRMDGAEHWAALIDARLGTTLAAGPVRLAAALTPPDILRREAGAVDRPGALPFAAERYQALTAALDRLAGRDDAAGWLPPLLAAHDRLMRGATATPPDRPLRMPCAEAPRFSIVVPAHDEWPITHQCLCALLLTCVGLPVEVILVDDGSTDATRDLERHWPGLRVVRHPEPLGYAQACEAGVAAARGTYLVLLNNDTEPMGRWLEELHLPFLAFAEVGATGSRLVWPDGRLQDAGGIVRRDGSPANLGSGGNPADPAWNHTRNADYLSGAALMVSRAAWDRVGGFDPAFRPAYYEDTDLAFRLREAGFATLYAPKSLVVHLGGASHGTDEGGTEGKRFQRLHAETFRTRWRHRFRDHGGSDADPRLDKDRAAIGRALVLDYQVPRFDRDAGSAAIAQEMRMLQHLGYKVALAPGNMAHLGPYTETLERAGVEALHAPFHASQAAVIAERGAEFDLFYLHRWATAQALVPLIRAAAPAARVLVNCADLHFLREMRAARLSGDASAFAAAASTREAEVAALSQADAVLTYSDVERGVLEALMGPSAPVHRIPFVAADAPPTRPLAERRDVGFLGSFDHPPNRDAVRTFLSDVWPALRERFPELRFRVAGLGFERFRLPVADDRVELVGHVPDALAFLGSCRVAVAPLTSGAGVKGKVVDALAAGTPGVASPVAVEGLELGDSAAVRVARTPAEWTDAVATLLTADAAWQEAASACAVQAARRSFATALPGFRAVLIAAGCAVEAADRPASQRVPAPVLSYDGLLRLARSSTSAA
jgi:GT2 family glycosyltransferase/glycosyltransferase involved in cell wall biosynthesis